MIKFTAYKKKYTGLRLLSSEKEMREYLGIKEGLNSAVLYGEILFMVDKREPRPVFIIDRTREAYRRYMLPENIKPKLSKGILRFANRNSYLDFINNSDKNFKFVYLENVNLGDYNFPTIEKTYYIGV